MKNGLLLLALGFLGGAAGATLGVARADKSVAPAPTCAQWQTSIASATEAHTLDKPPEYGSPLILASPAGGWEPFGVGPNGAIYYRRCAP
jgi:hypothetical protein